MRWIFWRWTRSSATEDQARLQEGKSEEISVVLETQESSTSAGRGFVLTSATGETGRERFFRRRHGKNDRIQLLPFQSGKSPETSKSSIEARQAPLQKLLLCAPPDFAPSDFAPSATTRIAYFTRGCYAGSGWATVRLMAPAISRGTPLQGFAGGVQRKALSADPENSPAQRSAKEG
jgi:hypothetical protein